MPEDSQDDPGRHKDRKTVRNSEKRDISHENTPPFSLTGGRPQPCCSRSPAEEIRPAHFTIISDPALNAVWHPLFWGLAVRLLKWKCMLWGGLFFA